MAPPGRQKSEREFCLFGGVLFVRRAAPYGRLVAFSKPAAVWPVGFCAWCFGVFSVGVPLPCSRPVGCPPFFVWPALPACRLAVVGFVSGLQAACRFCANFCAHCLVCPPCALCAQFRLVLAACLPVLRCLCEFSLLFFCPFLPNFFLSNLFSFVAQAATGISLLVPSRGFVSCLRILLSAAFSRAFAPIACLPVLRCLCGFSLSCFFALSCLTSFSQTSFHLSLRPRREFPCLSPPAALFPACAPLFCRLYADFCACLSGLRCRCPPCALCAQFRLVLAVCLPVLRCLCGFSLSCFLPFPA